MSLLPQNYLWQVVFPGDVFERKKKVSIYLYESDRKGETQRSSICWVILHVVTTAQGWAKPKPGARNSVQVSRVCVAGSPVLEQLSVTPQAHQQGVGSDIE